MENYLAKSFLISSYNLDPDSNARLTSLAVYFQEMAYLHARRLGFGFHDLKAKKNVWVLSRLRMQIARYPVWDEKITVETWHNGVEKLFGLRDFLVLDQDGSQLAKASSAWLILDVGTRRPVRPSEELLIPETGRGSLFETKLGKIEPGKELLFLNEKKVVYSDLDVVGHVNNVKYVEWCIDEAAELIVSHHGNVDSDRPVPKISELEINYMNEAKYGDRITIRGGIRHKLDTGEYLKNSSVCHFCGQRTNDGKEVFRAVLTINGE